MADQPELKAGHPPAGVLISIFEVAALSHENVFVLYIHVYCYMYVCSCVSSIMLLNNAVKAGGKRVVTKHKHEEADPDAYDQKYVDALPEPQ